LRLNVGAILCAARERFAGDALGALDSPARGEDSQTARQQEIAAVTVSDHFYVAGVAEVEHILCQKDFHDCLLKSSPGVITCGQSSISKARDYIAKRIVFQQVWPAKSAKIRKSARGAGLAVQNRV
jgi:hypothetical protein